MLRSSPDKRRHELDYVTAIGLYTVRLAYAEQHSSRGKSGTVAAHGLAGPHGCQVSRSVAWVQDGEINDSGVGCTDA